MDNSQSQATRKNRDALKTAAIALHSAYPSWPQARIAATIGVGKSSVGRFLNEAAEDQKPRNRDSTRPIIGPKGQQLTFESVYGIGEPSQAFGTAPETADFIAESGAVESLKRAAKELEFGARKMHETAEQLDALIKAAFARGMQAAQHIQD